MILFQLPLAKQGRAASLHLSEQKPGAGYYRVLLGARFFFPRIVIAHSQAPA
jgi:hypothetical protein